MSGYDIFAWVVLIILVASAIGCSASPAGCSHIAKSATILAQAVTVAVGSRCSAVSRFGDRLDLGLCRRAGRRKAEEA